MSESFSVETTESASRGHPHDLLARLYREIGLSAVAAALEVTLTFDDEPDAAAPDYAWVPREEDLAA
jgi:hypothetical protein